MGHHELLTLTNRQKRCHMCCDKTCPKTYQSNTFELCPSMNFELLFRFSFTDCWLVQSASWRTSNFQATSILNTSSLRWKACSRVSSMLLNSLPPASKPRPLPSSSFTNQSPQPFFGFVAPTVTFEHRSHTRLQLCKAPVFSSPIPTCFEHGSAVNGFQETHSKFVCFGVVHAVHCHKTSVPVAKPSALAAIRQSAASTASTSSRLPPQVPGEIPDMLIKQARASGQLNLSNRGLTIVPDKVWLINLTPPSQSTGPSIAGDGDRWWDQTDLTKLILASNKLTRIDAGIQNLIMLAVLDVHDNVVAEIDESIGLLVSLRSLNLSHNRLSQLPASLSNLTSLSTLLLNNNNLRTLPAGICRLVNLEELVSFFNPLRHRRFVPPHVC